MSAHALLSPSGAERWLNCTPSARLEAGFPNRAGQAAKEGTLAHSLAELMLLHKTGTLNALQYKARLKAIQADKLYDASMLAYMEDYTGYVIEQYSAALAQTKDAKIFLEQKLDLTDYMPEAFGTGDVIIIADNVLDIIDLKYGKGVPVSAEENKQMMLYALGALRDYDFMYDIHTVRMTICQPRLDSISVYELPVADLKTWADSELRPRAALAWEGKGEYKAGKHCRFCKAAGICKANADKNLELAAHDFADGALMKDTEVAEVLQRADIFRKWLTAVEDYALEQALTAGKKWPGLKLVEGRSNRQYSDPAKVEERLLATKAWAPEQIYVPKTLLGITALEKSIGKAVFQETVGDLLIKPPGKPTLVSVSDKRPELNTLESAATDFADVDI
jgi:hypothetical protein